MDAHEAEQAAARLRLAFDLFAAGEPMMPLNLRRRHPDATKAQIQARLEAWPARASRRRARRRGRDPGSMAARAATQHQRALPGGSDRGHGLARLLEACVVEAAE